MDGEITGGGILDWLEGAWDTASSGFSKWLDIEAQRDANQLAIDQRRAELEYYNARRPQGAFGLGEGSGSMLPILLIGGVVLGAVLLLRK